MNPGPRISRPSAQGRIIRTLGRVQRWSPALALAFAFLLVGHVAAAPIVDVESQIRRVAIQPYMKLLLVDGRQVVGRYQRFVGDWRDSVESSIRYERWRSENAPGLPRIGDPLAFVLTSRDTVRGELRGFAPNSILLATSNDAAATAVELGAIVDRWVEDRGAGADWPSMREQFAAAPSAAAVVLDQGTRTVIVLRDQIVAAEGPGDTKPAASVSNNGWVPVVVIGLVAVVVVCAVMLNDASNSLNDSFTNCGAAPSGIGLGGLSARTATWMPADTRHP